MNVPFLPASWFIALLLVAACPTFALKADNPAFALTIPSKDTPPSPAPEGMVWIPGGEFSMGSKGKSSANPAAHPATVPMRVRFIAFMSTAFGWMRRM